VRAIQNGNDSQYNTRQIIHPNEHLSYQIKEKPFEIYEEDFVKTMMDYNLFMQNIDAKEYGENILQRVLYSSEISFKNNKIIITLNK